MAVIDWVIVAIILVSSLLSLWRGFVRELLSLAAWILAFLAARYFSPIFANWLVEYVHSVQACLIIAYASIFFITLLAGSFFAGFVSKTVQRAGLSISDRLLGLVFGFARGLLILVVLYTLVDLFALQALLMDSEFVPYLEPLTGWTAQAISQISASLSEINSK